MNEMTAYFIKTTVQKSKNDMRVYVDNYVELVDFFKNMP